MIWSDDRIEEVEKLVNELRAISHWNAEYRQHDCPEWYETIAFVSRQKRRAEIMRTLLRVLR
jgi:hypothetical protein